MLDNCVQRKDYSVIKDQLPPKREYVLSVRLSQIQIDLYRAYLRSRNLSDGLIDAKDVIGGAQLFSDFYELSRVSTHPFAIKINEKRVELNELRAAERGFVCDEDEEDGSNDEAKSVDVKSEPSVPSPPTSVESNIDNEDDDDIIPIEAPVKQRR